MARHLMLIAAVLSAPVAYAQGLADPTLLPPGLGAAGSTAAVSSSPLQSIILSGERKMAVISGQIVPLGGAYGDSRLVSITPTQVTLKNGTTVEVLKLYQGIEKTPARSPVVKSSKEPASSSGQNQNRGK